MTKRLVQAQGGEISFTSRPRRGSTFTVSLEASARREVRLDAASARV